MKHRKLILFDVDGILIPSSSVEFDYWKAAVKKHFNLDTDRNDIYGEGKTDREILYEHLKDKGVQEPEKDARFLPALKDMGNIVGESIRDIKIRKTPNVERLLKALQKDKSNVIGLLTGNTYEKAKAKLENAGLWKYFKIGAFGDDTRVRSDLIEIAIQDAMEKLKVKIRKEDVFLVGDTLRDIRCAKEGGVRIISLATGIESIEQLRKEKPDFVFRDFHDIKGILSVINKG